MSDRSDCSYSLLYIYVGISKRIFNYHVPLNLLIFLINIIDNINQTENKFRAFLALWICCVGSLYLDSNNFPLFYSSTNSSHLLLIIYYTNIYIRYNTANSWYYDYCVYRFIAVKSNLQQNYAREISQTCSKAIKIIASLLQN